MSQRTPSHWRAMRCELAEHRLLQRRIAVVQLQRVGPAGEVGIAPVREDARAGRRPTDGSAAAGELLLGAVDEELRDARRPRRWSSAMWFGTKSSMSRRPRVGQPLAQPGERLVAAEVLVDVVVADGERRARDVGLAEVGQRALVLGEPLGFDARDAARRLAGLPHAEEPDQSKPSRPGGRARRRGCRRASRAAPAPRRARTAAPAC